MKNLKKAELAVICLTLLCLCFTAGYFVGRSSGAHVVTVRTLEPAAMTSASSAADTSAGPASEPDKLAPPVTEPASSASAASPEPDSGKLDLNAATAAELDTLPGIGSVIAQRIIDYREQHGGFKSTGQLKDIDGIGDKKFDAVKDMITVGG
jgi:competence protein ComEA